MVPAQRSKAPPPDLTWDRADPPDELDAHLSEGLQNRRNSNEYKRAVQTIGIIRCRPDLRAICLQSLRQWLASRG